MLRNSCLVIVFIFCTKIASSIQVHIQTDVFYPVATNYVEIILYLGPEELYWKTIQDSLKQTQLTWKIFLKKANQTIKAEAIQLNSPALKKLRPFLYNLRWAIDTGTYEVESQFMLQDSLPPVFVYNSFTVRQRPRHAFLSSLQLLSGFKKDSAANSPLSKSGFSYEPLPDYTLFKDQFYLNLYYEIYTELAGQKYVVKYSVSRKDSNEVFQKVYEVLKQRMGKQVDPVFYSQDFSSFRSGMYRMQIVLYQLDGIAIDSQSVLFTRENPFWDKIAIQYDEKNEAFRYFNEMQNDTVDYSIRALTAVTPSQDFPMIHFYNREKRYNEKKLYLLQFFAAKGSDAIATYKTYIDIARKVDDLYQSGFGYGFETDRGVIMMRYGQPDQIIKEDYDNGAFPYEIWKYDKLSPGAQTNVRFLFYNPDLAGSDFRLLHSTARGERFNRKWEYELYLNAKDEFKEADNLGRNGVQSNFNRRAREYFDN